MHCSNLVLLITAPKGKETRAEEEAGNTLFPYDPEVRIVRTRFPGVLLVFSCKLDADRAYILLRSRYQAYIRKTVPCHAVLRVPENAEINLDGPVRSLVSHRIKPGEPVRIDCVSRGHRLKCSGLKARIASLLRALGYRVSWHEYKWRIYVEGVDDIVILGAVKKH